MLCPQRPGPSGPFARRIARLRSRPARAPARRRGLPRPAGAILLAALALTGIASARAGALGATSAHPAHPAHPAHAAPTTPADLFMQSVVVDDGTLGWKQLCPSTQALVPESALVQQAGAEHAARAQQGLKLALDFLGARPRPTGGELRVYIVTGRWPNGAVQMATYSVLTQSSGCVEDVKHQ